MKSTLAGMAGLNLGRMKNATMATRFQMMDAVRHAFNNLEHHATISEGRDQHA